MYKAVATPHDINSTPIMHAHRALSSERFLLSQQLGRLSAVKQQPFVPRPSCQKARRRKVVVTHYGIATEHPNTSECRRQREAIVSDLKTIDRGLEKTNFFQTFSGSTQMAHEPTAHETNRVCVCLWCATAVRTRRVWRKQCELRRGSAHSSIPAGGGTEQAKRGRNNSTRIPARCSELH